MVPMMVRFGADMPCTRGLPRCGERCVGGAAKFAPRGLPAAARIVLPSWAYTWHQQPPFSSESMSTTSRESAVDHADRLAVGAHDGRFEISFSAAGSLLLILPAARRLPEARGRVPCAWRFSS